MLDKTQPEKRSRPSNRRCAYRHDSHHHSFFCARESFGSIMMMSSKQFVASVFVVLLFAVAVASQANEAVIDGNLPATKTNESASDTTALTAALDKFIHEQTRPHGNIRRGLAEAVPSSGTADFNDRAADESSSSASGGRRELQSGRCEGQTTTSSCSSLYYNTCVSCSRGACRSTLSTCDSRCGAHPGCYCDMDLNPCNWARTARNVIR